MLSLLKQYLTGGKINIPGEFRHFNTLVWNACYRKQIIQPFFEEDGKSGIFSNWCAHSLRSAAKLPVHKTSFLLLIT
jgi:hypothetical protein